LTDLLPPDLLLRAYANGLFPMAETAESEELFWFDPDKRGLLPLVGFHVPHKLRRTVRRGLFEVRADSDFRGVITACAAARPTTWINREIVRSYCRLHALGYAHSVETWQYGRLVGGLYGVALGGAFFGESMFSTTSDASKVALVHLVARLRRGGFVLLDTQFITEHLSQFGAFEVPRDEYRALLHAATHHRGASFMGATPGPEDFEALFAGR
jgi:leucyl/phenylalanyl-tRNA--protein transferase